VRENILHIRGVFFSKFAYHQAVLFRCFYIPFPLPKGELVLWFTCVLATCFLIFPLSAKPSDSADPKDSKIADKKSPAPAKKRKGFFITFQNKDEPAVVPFQRAGSHLVVPVRINDRDAGYFLVDTGAYCNIIDTQVAKELGIKPTGNWSLSGIGGGDKAEVVMLDSLSMGPLLLENHSLLAYSLKHTSDGIGIKLSGILGAILWGRLPFTLDYETSTLTFYPVETFTPPKGARKEKLWVSDGHPHVKCKLDGKEEGWFLLDSGAGGGLNVDLGFLTEHPDFLKGKQTRNSFVTGIVGMERVISSKLDTFEIFGKKLLNIPADFGKPEVKEYEKFAQSSESNPKQRSLGLVGESVLRNFRLTFDYLNNELWVEDQTPTAWAKANPQDKDLAGHTPLMRSIRYEDASTMEKLLQTGADPNAKNVHEMSALMFAIHMDRADLAKKLIEKGAKVYSGEKNESTGLHIATQTGNTEIFNILLEKGAPVGIQDERGFTPIAVAAFNGHPYMVKALIVKGADLNVADKKGFTPLMLAVWNKQTEIVKLLLQGGAKTSQKNKEGQTALDIAKAMRFKEIEELLKAFGPAKK
jgi:uncharacterized protein